MSGDTQYTVGDGYARSMQQSRLPVAGRVVIEPSIESRVSNTNGQTYENEVTPLSIEIKPEKSIALLEAHLDHLEAGKPEGAFAFEVKPIDLTVRTEQALERALGVNARRTEPAFAQPIVGLDIDADGEPIDVSTLQVAIRRAEIAASREQGTSQALSADE